MTQITTEGVTGVAGYDLQCTFPWFWPGKYALSGASAPWSNAPIGSLYIRITAGSVEWWLKTAHNEADADWKEIMCAGATITGDLTMTGTLTVTGDASVTGTVTAGDVVVET